MRNEPKYAYLVAALFASILVITAAPPLGLVGILGVLSSNICLVVTAYLVTEERRQRLLVVLLGVAAFLPLVWVRFRPGVLTLDLAQIAYVIDLLLWLLFTLTTTIIVFRGIVTARQVRTNEIFGVIHVYLLIGVLFAQAYQLLLAVQPTALYFDPIRFAEPLAMGSGLSLRSTGDVVYYSFVTLGTVGYGDITPATSSARAMSLAEAVIGVMYVATMIARFVSIKAGGRSSES